MMKVRTRGLTVRLVLVIVGFGVAGVAMSPSPWAAEDLPMATAETVGMSSAYLPAANSRTASSTRSIGRPT